MKNVLLVVLLAACGSTPAPLHNAQPPPKIDTSTRATSLADAMRLRGLTPITLQPIKQEMSSAFGTPPTQRGRDLVVFETAGWNSAPSVFARRESDGKIVLVTPWANEIVDRHEPAGCLHFAGGRGWFEEVTYRLPDGAKFGGTEKVEYDHHVVVKDYSERQPDGTPCPPPAID